MRITPDEPAIVTRLRAVFNDHKTEMLIAAGIGALIGAILF